MNTRTDYEKWLNGLGCPDHNHPDNDGRVPCICIDIYGTWLRCNDPIAFNMGYHEWEITMKDRRRLKIMKVFTVTDHTGATTKHLAVNKISAVQAHLVHFGLTWLNEEPIVDEGIDLLDFKDSRNNVCWDTCCCTTGATLFKKIIIQKR